MVKATIEGKRIRRYIKAFELLTTSVKQVETLAISMTDEIRLIGFRLVLRISYPDAPAFQAGLVDAGAHLTVGGNTGTPQTIGNVSGRSHYIANATYSLMITDDACLVQDVMFPEGYGIDFDENDILNVHLSGRQTILLTGTVMLNAQIILYMVER